MRREKRCSNNRFKEKNAKRISKSNHSNSQTKEKDYNKHVRLDRGLKSGKRGKRDGNYNQNINSAKHYLPYQGNVVDREERKGKRGTNIKSSIDNSIIRRCDERDGRFIVYGSNAVKGVLKNQSRKIIFVICTEDGLEEVKSSISGDIDSIQHKVILTSQETLCAILRNIKVEARKYSVILYVGRFEQNTSLDDLLKSIDKINIDTPKQDKESKDRFLGNINSEAYNTGGIQDLVNGNRLSTFVILDGITDPRNIGAIIRSARAFGINAVIMQRKNSPEINTTIIRSSAGYCEEINIYYVTNLVNTIKKLQKHEFHVFGLDGDSSEFLDKNIFNKEDKKICFVMGSEGYGMSRIVKENCDRIIKIPMMNKVESLNVASAATISFYMSSLTRE